jgi:anti-sigma factor ChrR (cupin superfamily)
MIAPHESINDEFLGLAALYSMKALDGSEAFEFETHLKSGCLLCQTEVANFERVAAQLGSAAQPASPPLKLREKLLSAVAADTISKKAPAPQSLHNLRVDARGLLVLFASQMKWQGAEDAIQTKELFADSTTHYSTFLLRAAPGTRFPGHRHVGTEEVYVLDGDFHVGDMALAPGDYCRAESGTIHQNLFTEHGCTLLVHASQLDEVFS